MFNGLPKFILKDHGELYWELVEKRGKEEKEGQEPKRGEKQVCGGHQMGPRKLAAGVSPTERSPFLCKKEVYRPIKGACEGNRMNVQESYERALPIGLPDFTQKRTSHVLYTRLPSVCALLNAKLCSH